MATKITKSELKDMIREVLREELSRSKPLKEAAYNRETVSLDCLAGDEILVDKKDVALAKKLDQEVCNIIEDAEISMMDEDELCAEYGIDSLSGIELFEKFADEAGLEFEVCEDVSQSSLAEAVDDASGYRVVLADYDTDDFDINVEFGIQDPDENEVVDYEYLLEPGQTKGDLVVYLSRDCGFTSIYVHDERPASASDIKRLSSDTFPVTGTDEYDWQNYGTMD
jgi:hypothetical protein